MAAEVKKTGNKSTKSTSGKGSTGGTKRKAPESMNINGRRNSAGTRTSAASGSQAVAGRKKTDATELEKRGYISRKNPADVRDKSKEAKRDDIIIIVVTLVCILMVLSYLKICGVVGTGINAFIFGLFGRLGYILPFIIWVLTLFIIANKDNGVNPLSIVYAVLLSGVLGALIQLAVGGYEDSIGLFEYFSHSSLEFEGELATYGGLLGGVFVKLLCPLVGKVAAVLVLIALLLILFVLMTGKPFIMAVVRKINKRINDYRRRRAIEKNEREYYDELEDDNEEDYTEPRPEHRVRYGPRRIPDRRMGTMNVSFTKKNGSEPAKEGPSKPVKEKPSAVKETKKDAAGNRQNRVDRNVDISKNTVKEEEKTVKKASPAAPQTLYIPGVGNVMLGNNPSLDIKEEEYTDKDFAETGEVLDLEENIPKRDTVRKQDITEENERITSVGIKTLHSGSINRTSENNVTNIFDIHSKAVNNSKTDDDVGTDELYDADETENVSEEELYDIKSDDTVGNDAVESISDTRVQPDNKEESENIKVQDDGHGYSNEEDIAKHVHEMLDEQEEDHPQDNDTLADENPQQRVTDITDIRNLKAVSDVKNSEEPSDTKAPKDAVSNVKENNAGNRTKEAEKQYENVTRIGSGAAVFTDMTKAAKEPEKPEMPEYIFPPLSLLKKGKVQQTGNTNKKEELEATIRKLQTTFESFGVGVKVTDASVGPTVTRYELLPDQGVKVKTITSLSDDIKLALAATEIRIEAPIPGKAAVGIEVPNKESSPVLFGDIIDSDEFRKSKSNLAFTVGKDIGGKSVVSDIGDMPHCLIAGATGSGKSVCINALIMSILYKAKPSDVKMIMIDPKRVELVGYNGIPHLIVPVVTDVKKAAGALAWAVAEMDNRYKLFADAGVRDLAAYNNHMMEKWMDESNEGECPDKLPQIVIIVDELNDLMMTANSKDIEGDIARLTQLARACGIHVILATQRPSVNVITGTIKANIPTRIAFSVSSIVDSRTILDQAGAEKLLGKGDMLYYPRGYAKPVRLQGVYVSDKEVNEVVSFIKKQYKEMKYNELVSQHIEAKAAGASQAKDEGGQQEQDANDEFFEEAARLIIKKQKASVGMLQREFRIGFNRAARIMDKLSEEGIVGPEESTKPRKILMTEGEFEEYLNGK